jgi:hypothetical protein
MQEAVRSGVVYHRTTRGNWKGILDNGFIPGVGNEYLPAELIAILARLVSKKAITCPDSEQSAQSKPGSQCKKLFAVV